MRFMQEGVLEGSWEVTSGVVSRPYITPLYPIMVVSIFFSTIPNMLYRYYIGDSGKENGNYHNGI